MTKSNSFTYRNHSVVQSDNYIKLTASNESDKFLKEERDSDRHLDFKAQCESVNDANIVETDSTRRPSRQRDRLYFCNLENSDTPFLRLVQCPKKSLCRVCQEKMVIQTDIEKRNRKLNIDNNLPDNKPKKDDNLSKNKNRNYTYKYFWNLTSLDLYLEQTLRTDSQSYILQFTKQNKEKETRHYKCKHWNIMPEFCSSFITITKDLKPYYKVTAYYYHNHEIDIIQLSYPITTTNKIKAKLKDGVTVDRIYNDQINDVKTEFIKSNFISKNYIRVMQSKLYSSGQTRSDFENFTNYIEDLKKNSEYIELTDRESMIKVKTKGIKGNTFNYAFTTKDMIKNYDLYSAKEIFFDTTFSTNRYKFYLTVGIVINNCQLASPFLFIISNSEKEELFKPVFCAFKKHTDSLINPGFFMSDMAPNLWNTWKSVFPGRTKRLWCYFHFIKAVKKNINVYINNKDIRRKTMNMLDNFKYITEHASFIREYNVFLLYIKDSAPRFETYFKKNYGNKTNLWAPCLRLDSFANTNNYCEAFFSKLKRVYLKWNIRSTLQNLIGKCIQCKDEINTRSLQSVVTKKIDSYRVKKSTKNHTGATKLKNVIFQTNNFC